MTEVRPSEIGRRALLGVVALVLVVRPAASAEREPLDGPKLDAVLADVAKARKGVTTLTAAFTQSRRLALLATDVKSTGHLSFVAPDRLRWELAPPDDVIYWIGPEGLSYRTRSGGATAAPRGAAVANALADVRALLGGDLGALRERYVLGGTRSDDAVEITGAAKDPKARVKSFVLVLDKTLTLPVRARLVEGTKDTIDIAFSNAKVNGRVDPASMKP